MSINLITFHKINFLFFFFFFLPSLSTSSKLPSTVLDLLYPSHLHWPNDSDVTHLLIATARALDQIIDSLVINRPSICRREKFRKKQVKNLREGFQINSYKTSVIHWDEKLFPALIFKNLVYKIPVTIFSKNKEQLLGVPKLSVGIGEKAENVYTLLEEWDFKCLCCSYLL